jgi:hypothetical protein
MNSDEFILINYSFILLLIKNSKVKLSSLIGVS